MGSLDPWISRVATAHALLVACSNTLHALRTRGLRSALMFAALGTGVPILAELLAVNGLKMVRHHVRPRVGGVPLAIALGWYNVIYGTFTVAGSVARATGTRSGSRALMATATALAATDLDLALDPFGLHLGLWEWSDDGRYAREIQGPNHRRGVPWSNFLGWMLVSGSVALAYGHLDSSDAAESARPGSADGATASRGVALLLLSYFIPVAAWSSRKSRRRYLLLSAPFVAATSWAALKGD